MAVATEDTIQAAMGKAIVIHKELFAQLATGTNNLQARDATFLAAVPADASPATQAAQAAFRAACASPFAAKQLASILAPLFAAYARTLDLPGVESMFVELFANLHGRSETVLNRAFTFGTWSAVTGTGTGAIKRLTKDEYDYTIESGFAELKTAKCYRDATSGGTRHEEEFSIYGEAAGKDALELNGSGVRTNLACLSARTTENYVVNPSFENVNAPSGTLAAGGVLGWTESDIANLVTVTSSFYKDNPRSTTSRCLRFSTNASIYQRMIDIPLNRWNPAVPLYAQIAFNRESSCDGTLTLTIGSTSASVALSAQSGWTVLTFPITTAAWFRTWNKSVPSGTLTNSLVKIELSSRTTGTLLIDDLIVGPYTRVDGAWVAMVGGATPFLKGDLFTVTDTCADTGIVQTWLARTFGIYLPHTSGSPTWAEPT